MVPVIDVTSLFINPWLVEVTVVFTPGDVIESANTVIDAVVPDLKNPVPRPPPLSTVSMSTLSATSKFGSMYIPLSLGCLIIKFESTATIVLLPIMVISGKLLSSIFWNVDCKDKASWLSITLNPAPLKNIPQNLNLRPAVG